MRVAISRGGPGGVDCCLLCGLSRWHPLPDEHGCVPNLGPEDLTRLGRQLAQPAPPVPGRGYFNDVLEERRRQRATALRPEKDAGPPDVRLLGLLRTVERAPVGQRNSTLHWAACRVGEMLAAGEVAGTRRAADALLMVAEAAGLDRREIVATVRSGFTTSGVSL